MKKIIILSICFFIFSSNIARASQNFPDICESKYKDSFKTLCEKAENSEDGETGETKSLKSLSAESNSEVKTLESEEEPYEIITEDEEWTGDRTFNQKIIVIDYDATVKIKTGVTISLKNSYFMVFGKLIAEGENGNYVRFRAVEGDDNDGYFIATTNEDKDGKYPEIKMRYTDISEGGLPNEEIEGFPFPALVLLGGTVNFEECNIHDNNNGFISGLFQSGSKINRTKFYNNNFDLVSFLQEEFSKPNFQYNWWGNSNGPAKKEDGTYEKIYGNIDVSPWFVSEDFFDPVIIIPGITGSQKDVLGWHLDPITHTYDNLLLSFEDNGYEKEKNLFEFPYEWRNNNVYTAEELKKKIDEIKEKNGLSAVNIVAHSMGGLVARQYIESENYEDDVNQLITLGTPHRGAPKTYPRWEAGEGFFEVDEIVAKKLFQIEALHLGYLDLGKYIREKIESVGQLLPDYSYLKEASSGEIRNYPENYPENTFLGTLNAESNVNKLDGINFINIIGNLIGPEKTISGFRVVDVDEEDAWQHGVPENFYDSSTNRGIEYGLGDQTVPLESATGVDAGENIEVDSTHGELPTKAQCNVIKKLTGKEECKYVDEIDRIIDILTFGVFSPVDIQVITPSGWAGKNILGKLESEMLPNAYYTGSNTENEFLTIPISGSDEKDFEIIIQGTGEGEYKIGISRITESEDSGEAKEINATISGTAVPDQEESADLKVTEKEIIVESDKILPEISIIFPEENKAYLNSGTIPVSYEISDNKSPEEKITREIYLDENSFEDESISPAFLHLGEHKIKIVAEDEAGNIGQKEVSFKIETSVDAIIDNADYYYSLGMIKKQDKVVLVAHLEIIKQLQETIALLEKNRFIKKRTREMLITNLEKKINFHLDWLSFYVEMRSDPNFKNNIDTEAGKLLVESFNFLKYNFLI